MAYAPLTWSQNSFPPAIFRFREYVLEYYSTGDRSH